MLRNNKLKGINNNDSKAGHDKVKIAKEMFDIETSISKYAKDNTKFKKFVNKIGLSSQTIFFNPVKKETLKMNYELNELVVDKIEKAKKDLEQEVKNNPKRQQDFDELDVFFKMVGAMK